MQFRKTLIGRRWTVTFEFDTWVWTFGFGVDLGLSMARVLVEIALGPFALNFERGCTAFNGGDVDK